MQLLNAFEDQAQRVHTYYKYVRLVPKKMCTWAVENYYIVQNINHYIITSSNYTVTYGLNNI